jgi:Ca-activated chloride channel family protein
MDKVPASRDPWTIVQGSQAAMQVDSFEETINVGGRAPNQPAPVPQAPGYVNAVRAEDSPAFYAPIVENGYKATKEEATTTFSIDVDTASYANVRRFLTSSQMPPANAVRIEEMVNYFTYHYAQPKDGRPFAVASEVAGCPWEPKHRLMRIGIQAKNLDQWKLAPNNLVFLLDVSGSMSPTDRLPLIKSALRLLVDQLRANDSVAIVVYAGAAGLVLPRTSGADKKTILAALDNLQAGGSTAGGAGIELAYKVARDNFQKDGNNRVILATDGDFNVGVSSVSDLTKLIEEQRTRGIYLTCLGVGNDNLQDGTIEMLADKGNGNYYYLDTLNEAKKVFQQQLQGTLVSVADDMKVQLEFNPSAVASYRQIGYENRAMANKDFTDDTKDAGELGSGDSVTVLYEIEPASPRTLGQIATLKIRYKDPGAATSQEMASAINDEGKGMFDASPDTQFAAAVAEFGMLLRNSKFKGTSNWADVSALARAMRGEDFEGYREEFLRMLESGRSMVGDRQVAVK